MKRNLIPALLVPFLAAACCSRPWKQTLISSEYPVTVYLEERAEEDPAHPAHFSHPARVSENELRGIFQSIQYSSSGFFTGAKIEPVFQEAEVKALAASLVPPMENVSPRERIRFLVSRTAWGFFGVKVISGVIFFETPGQMNIAFDLLDKRIAENDANPRAMVFCGDPVEYTGSKEEIIPPAGARIRRGEKDAIHPRWLVVDLEDFRRDWKEAKKEEAGEKPPRPSAEEEAEEIRRRLEVIEKLRADGTISEEEYGKLREKILFKNKE